FGALAAAASVGLVFLACRRLASAQASFVAALVYAFATSTWSTSGQQLTMHAPSQLFIALGLYLLARGDRWSARAGLALGVGSLGRDTSLAAVAPWLVYATFGYWWGGWTYGNRYLSDVLPAFALATAYAVDSGALASAAARAAAALAFAWSALLQFAGAAYFY